MISFIKKVLLRKLTLGQAFNYWKFKHRKLSCNLNYDPIVLSIQTTYNCTFKCDMCQTHSRKIPRSIYHCPKVQDINFKIFKEFIDRFQNALSVWLVGVGEPLLNKDLFKMADYASYKKKMRVHTISNGTILGNSIDKILNSGFHAIEISLNGHNAEEFNRMTGNAKKFFPIICNNVRNLMQKRNQIRSKLKITASFILDQQNYKNIFQMIKRAEDLGLDGATFHNFLSSPTPEFTAPERSLYKDNKNVVKIFAKIKNTNYKIPVSLPKLLDKNRDRRYCQEHFELLRVDGRGDIGGCGGQLLNLAKNGKFYDKDAWDNSYFQKMRSLYFDSKLPEPDPCKTCPSNQKP